MWPESFAHVNTVYRFITISVGIASASSLEDTQIAQSERERWEERGERVMAYLSRWIKEESKENPSDDSSCLFHDTILQ